MAAAALAPSGREYHFEDSQFTFPVLATGITNTATGRAAVVGYAVSIDTNVTPTYGQPVQVKLAADGDEIFGRLEILEDRSQDGLGLLGTVSLRFVGALPLKASETPAPGSSLLGAGAGEVKARGNTANTGTGNLPVPGKAKHMDVYGYTAGFVNVAFGV